jgi:hypothetical protein
LLLALAALATLVVYAMLARGYKLKQ